jgi:hypothetical protein
LTFSWTNHNNTFASSQLPGRFVGVMKQLLRMWDETSIKRKKRVQLPNAQFSNGISNILEFRLTNEKFFVEYVKLKPYFVSEFQRKPQGRKMEYGKLKGSEGRNLILYWGVVLFKKLIPEAYYANFLKFHTAIKIMCHSTLSKELLDTAEQLLIDFVREFEQLYGTTHVSFNVHNTIHLAADVAKYRPLDSFSAFKFENAFMPLKRRVKRYSQPLEQIHNRFREEENVNLEPKKKEQLKITACGGRITKIKTDKFSFLVHPPNNYCFVNNSVVEIKKIQRNGDTLTVSGYELLELTSAHKCEVSSELLGIYKPSFGRTVQCAKYRDFPLSDVKNKVMFVEYADKIFYFFIH